METLIGLGLKSLLIAGVTLGLLHFTRRRSAADRSWIAHLGLFALVALPLASLALPALSIEVPALREAVPTAAPTPLPATIPADVVEAPSMSSATPIVDQGPPFDWTPIAYAIPALALLLVTLIALLRLFALRGRAQVMIDPVWLSALAHAQRRMGFKNGTALLTSSELSSPISWGLMRLVILLNDEAVCASHEAEAILAHELAHVARFDWAKLMLARVATAIFWFNPLTWVLAREAHQLREEAADDAVLGADISDTDYAQLLVGVARHECRGLLLGAHGISPGKGSLRRRVSRVLDASVSRGAGGRSWVAGFAAGMLVISAPLAALTFAPQAPIPPQPPRPAPRAPLAPAAPSAPLAPATPLTSMASVAPSPPISPLPPVAPAAPMSPLPPMPPLETAIATTVSAAVRNSLAATAEATRGFREADRAIRDADRAMRDSDRAMRVRSRAHPANVATEMRILGVTPAYIASIRAAGPQFRKLADRDMIELRVKRVTPDLIRALAAAGYGHESPDAIGDAAVLGVTADTIREYSRVGPRRSLSDLTELRMMGVTPGFIEVMRRDGQPPLTKRQLIELRLIGRHGAVGRRSP